MHLNNGRWYLGLVAGLVLPATLLAANAPAAPAAKASPSAPTLPAAQIVDKFYAARGGLQAWQAVQSISWNGKMEVGYGDSAARSARFMSNAARAHNAKTDKQKLMLMEEAATQHAADKQVELPFLLEMKRPNKSRVEIEFSGKTAIQVYDGTDGWMLRPYLNRDDWEPFSPEQSKMQAAEPGLDGLLFDHVKRGIRVDAAGVESVEGHPAYKLKLTMKNGDVRNVWIDAKSFLDVKIEGTPRRMDGAMHKVFVFQRDFRKVQDVTLPFVLETVVDGYTDTHKMTIEKVGLNPQLDDNLFVKPRA